MPRAVQVAAELYRDDLAFRAARALERGASLPLANPAETGQMRPTQGQTVN
jgi:aspartyl-tRNA(Asn)/glutamyl-tRNA(Gln) amidotransferase subunit A